MVGWEIQLVKYELTHNQHTILLLSLMVPKLSYVSSVDLLRAIC